MMSAKGGTEAFLKKKKKNRGSVRNTIMTFTNSEKKETVNSSQQTLGHCLWWGRKVLQGSHQGPLQILQVMGGGRGERVQTGRLKDESMVAGNKRKLGETLNGLRGETYQVKVHLHHTKK